MPRPERVMIDTSAFYALLSTGDEFHVQARHTYDDLIDHEDDLWTTSYVLVETTALMHRRLGFPTLEVFADSIKGIVQVFWVESSVHNEAWRRFAENRGAGLGFVDWTTAVATRRLRAQVFTFDQAFGRQGIAVIPR